MSNHATWILDKIEEALNDSRSTDDLIKLALTSREWDDPGDKALMLLCYRGNREVLDAAIILCQSQEWRERELGIQILGMLSFPNRTFPDESLHAVLELLKTEQDPEVLSAIGYAIRDLNDVRGVKPLSMLKNHPREDVRLSVVHGMLGSQVEIAIQTLIELSGDVDGDVRNWATFGLGQQLPRLDTPDIREALATRLYDSNEDVHLEATVGLALRGDKRALVPLREILESDDGFYDHLGIFEGAWMLADPSLLLGLLSWREEGKIDADLEEAIAACGGEALPHEEPYYVEERRSSE